MSLVASQVTRRNRSRRNLVNAQYCVVVLVSFGLLVLLVLLWALGFGNEVTGSEMISLVPDVADSRF